VQLQRHLVADLVWYSGVPTNSNNTALARKIGGAKHVFVNNVQWSDLFSFFEFKGVFVF
jgi:hypothetical protein